MKTTTLMLFTLFLSTRVLSNINFIDANKITDPKAKEFYEEIKTKQHLFDHWSATWNYDVTKESLVTNLKTAFSYFVELKSQNIETLLLRGDIAHYLYNLDENDYHENAIEAYGAASALVPGDYRSFWFKAVHFSLSTNNDKALIALDNALEKLPKKVPSEFWASISSIYYLAGMQFNCLYAWDQYTAIEKKPCDFENLLGETVYKNILPSSRTASYERAELWSAKFLNKVHLKSYTLGIKFAVDSTDGLELYDFQNSQAAVMYYPPMLRSSKGKEIGYTIGIFVKSPEKSERLEDYLSIFIDKSDKIEKIQFSDKYDGIIAYKIKDPQIYPENDGGRIYMIGVERKQPENPGVKIEESDIQIIGDGELRTYTLNKVLSRIEGKLFYMFILDSCGAIEEESLKEFKDFFENNVVIE